MLKTALTTTVASLSLVGLALLPANAGTARNTNSRGFNFGTRVEAGRVNRTVRQNTIYNEAGTGIDGALKVESSSKGFGPWGRSSVDIATINGRLYTYDVNQTTNIVQTEEGRYLDIQASGEVYSTHEVQTLQHRNW